MLSYQHSYHAGNLADVHKHSLLAWMLEYLCRKDKPLSYLETHAGRALYDLNDDTARKTGEAAQGIEKRRSWFQADHPYAQVLDQTIAAHGPHAYPGSPLIAAQILRASDSLHLAELHPAEHAALSYAMSPYPIKCHHSDGFEMAFALIPPMPRRGLLLIDPSFEIKADYETVPRQIAKLTRAWNVGIIVLWYPILTNGAHVLMLQDLQSTIANGFCHEVRFPPARLGHGMVGSGLFVINPPYGFDAEANRLAQKFATLR